MSRSKRKEKKEFSKVLYITVLLMVIVVFLFSMALMWKTESTDALSYLIPTTGGFFSVTIGFYYSKSKLENSIKLRKKYGLDKEEFEEIENEMNDESEE